MEFCISNSEESRKTQKDSRKNTGRSSVLEMTRSGMELFLMVKRFKDTGHPVFKSISALSRGILKKKNGRDTIHFNADASNTELLF